MQFAAARSSGSAFAMRRARRSPRQVRPSSPGAWRYAPAPPVLALSGDMPRQFRGTDYIQATEPDLLFRDVALYTETISSPGQAPAVIHQAIAAAYGGRGVAHLTLPQDVIAAKAEGSVGSVATLRPRQEFSPSGEEVAEVVRRINAA